MKKKISLFIFFLLFLLCGCSSKKEEHTRSFYTELVTGDSIHSEIDLSKKYTYEQLDHAFIVKKDKKKILNAIFVSKELYDRYHKNIKDCDDIEIVEIAKSYKNKFCIFKDYKRGQNDKEEELIVFMEICESKTGVIMTSPLSKKELVNLIDELSIQKIFK